jgi:CheY-like chemotaxis protein
MAKVSSCPNCGSPPSEDARRCPSCGWDFTARKRTAKPEADVPAARGYDIPPARNLNEPTERPVAATSPSYNILVVEDDEGYQELARTLLNEYGLTICPSVAEGWALLQKKSFDLILLDINFTGTSGLELIDQLKLRGLTESIPVVMCSGMTDSATRAASMERGAAGFLVKPYDGAALQKMVKALLPPR